MAVWKICKRSFKCDIAGSSCFIRLEMAQEWMKTLPYSTWRFNCIQKILKRSSSLWRALTFKWFELQIWDCKSKALRFLGSHLGLVLNERKFKNLWKYFENKSSKGFFFSFFYELSKRYSFFNVAFTVLTIRALYLYVISKRKKLQQPAWSHFEDLLKSYKSVMDFAMFFSLDECETLKNILSLFFCFGYNVFF